MKPPPVMTTDELAQYLQIANSTLYKPAQEDKLPTQKVHKHWRFHRDAIDDWHKTHPRPAQDNRRSSSSPCEGAG